MSTIIHLGKFYPPESGGIETVTQTLSRGAVAAGHQVGVVAFTANVAGHRVQDGVEIHRFQAKRFGSQPLSWRYFWHGLRLARRSDITHVHVPNVLAALMTPFLGRRPKVVVHWHSDIVGKGMYGRLVEPLQQWMLQRADVIICTSPPYAEHSRPLQRWRNKIRIVSIGVEPPAIPVTERGLAAHLADFIAGRKLILSVGRLVEYKGFAHLIDAARELPDDTVVVIAGTGPLLSQLQGRINRFDLSSRVLLAGHVSDDELNRLFERASLFCLPSLIRSEAFGVVLLEAMARGVPVVSSNIEGSGVPWVNLHGETGLNTKPGDAGELAQACNRILRDSALHRQLAEGAQRRFASHFTEDISVERMLTIYLNP